jgi:hypothetical protein
VEGIARKDMKTKILKSRDKDQWALPGNPISQDEFEHGIQNAEKGPFYTVGESKKLLEVWRKQKNSR